MGFTLIAVFRHKVVTTTVFSNKDLTNIREVCLDSVAAIADDVASINISGLGNGTYWLYARDRSGNISEYKEFTIAGVGIQSNVA